MNSLVCSSPNNQQVSLKSKWNNFKTLITPDLTKRRSSQCSTTSTHSTCSIATATSSSCCNNATIPDNFNRAKRPSLAGSTTEGLVIVINKCMSPFRTRPSNAPEVSDITAAASMVTTAATSTTDSSEETEKIKELYYNAMEEINYAKDSVNTLYYRNDRIAAKEAIEKCEEYYQLLLEKDMLDSIIEFEISTLTIEYNSLPDNDYDNDDHHSFLETYS